MYDAESLRLFAAAKAICDPDNLLNPGNLVDPAPLDAGPAAGPAPAAGPPALRLPHDGGSLGDAVHRCTGVGKCVAPSDERRDVPVLPGDPRGEGLHPRPRPGAPGGHRRLAGQRVRRPRGRRGARPLPGLQGMRVGLPDRRGHGDLQGRGALPAVRRPGRHRAPAAQPPPAGSAPEVGRPGRPDGAGGEPDDAARPGRPRRSRHRRHRPAPLAPDVRPRRRCGSHPPPRRSALARRPGRAGSGRTPSPTTSCPRRARRDPGARGRGAPRPGDPPTTPAAR